MNVRTSEALVAMLASARLGAVHCVVFGGQSLLLLDTTHDSFIRQGQETPEFPSNTTRFAVWDLFFLRDSSEPQKGGIYI